MEIFAAVATFIIGLAAGLGIGYRIGKDRYQTNHLGVRNGARLKL